MPGPPRDSRRPLAAFAALTLWAWSAAAQGAPVPEPAKAAVFDPNLKRVGPLSIDESARMRVRGDRPEGAALHVAFAGPRIRPDAALRAELEAFERKEFPETAPPRTTIVTTPPDPWMRDLARPGLPVRWNRALVQYLRWFRDDPSGRSLARAWSQRLVPHEARMKAILKEVGVPTDLVAVALVESGMDARAKSWVGAAGPWQFMEPTGAVYGLSTDHWIDNRLDIEQSTWAAAAYLEDLRVRFGSWELALAAYNAGYGAVMKTMRDHNTNNYWALCELENGLPHQTVQYVPKIVATAIVLKNPAVFGLSISTAPIPVSAEVLVPPGTKLADLARALDRPAEDLERMNPSLIRGRTPPEGAPPRIRIPREALPTFQRLGAQLRAAVQPYGAYAVLLGEDLDDLAHRHGITTKELRRLNGIFDAGEVGPGVTLVVPTARPVAEIVALPAPVVAVPELAIGPAQRLVFLRITRSSTPRAIATAFGVAWEQIVAWNDLDPDARLVDGQMLQMLVPSDFAPADVRLHEADSVRRVVRGTREHLDALLGSQGLVRRGYRVRENDTLAAIAHRFSIAQGSLARINGIARNAVVRRDDVLVLYVSEHATRGTVPAPPPRPTTLVDETEVLQTPLEPADASERSEASTPDSARLPGRRKRHP